MLAKNKKLFPRCMSMSLEIRLEEFCAFEEASGNPRTLDKPSWVPWKTVKQKGTDDQGHLEICKAKFLQILRWQH